MKKKLHFHSDCFFFAGCEAMLINFWMSQELKQNFDISFSYRSSKKYDEGLAQRITCNFPLYPQRFVDFSDPEYMSSISHVLTRRVVKFINRTLLIVPLFFFLLVKFYFLLKKINPDVVHINNGGYPAAFSPRVMAIAAKLAQVPIKTMVVNNLAVDYQQGSRALDYPLDILVKNSLDFFITGSRAAQKQLQNVLHLKESHVISLHNGIRERAATESVSETKKRLGLESFTGVIFGIVALLQENKGHKYLLEAIVNLVNKDDNLEGFIVLIEGTGPDEEKLKEYVKNNKIEKYCQFVGTEKNIVHFMASLDVLVLASIGKEDFPNVILEAMSLEKPVIASIVAGTPEQVDHENSGLLVKAGHSIELAEAMMRLLKDKSLRERMGIKGKELYLKHFTAAVSVKKYLELYNKKM